MKEYKIAKGWAIFTYTFAPLLIGLFGWVLILPFRSEDFSPNAAWILIPVSIAMIVLMIFSIVDTYKSKILIQKDCIKSINSLSNKELKFEEIQGYIVNNQYIFVEPKDKQKKTIKISKYIRGYSEILYWLSENFPDLDLQNAAKEEQEILNDKSIGWTKEEREEKLKKARQTAKVLNWAAGIAAAWTIFYPRPYQYAILFSIIIPIVALVVTKIPNGLFKIDEKKGSAYPSVIYAFIYPSSGILLRALLDYEIFSYENVWLTTIILSICFILLLLIKQNEITFKKKIDIVKVGSLSLFVFAYSYGVVIHYNCYYDNSEAQLYTAKVLNKRISSGKSKIRYLELTSWGPQEDINKVSVGRGLYNRTEVGDEVNIYFRRGKLNIPWFIVTDK